jgi:hypothetical protein
MTLGEVLSRATKLPEIGDHEIVLDEAGVAHMLVISSVEHAELGERLAGTLGFICPCMTLKPGTKCEELVVAPNVTCIDCVSR